MSLCGVNEKNIEPRRTILFVFQMKNGFVDCVKLTVRRGDVHRKQADSETENVKRNSSTYR